MKLSLIRSIAIRSKIKVLGIVIMLSMIFSVYFLVTYLIQVNSYKLAAKSGGDLALIYNKEVCFENLIIFLR